MRAYFLAMEGRSGPSTQLLQLGAADMDRSISLAPDRADLRLLRGFITYQNIKRDQMPADLEDNVELDVSRERARSLKGRIG